MKQTLKTKIEEKLLFYVANHTISGLSLKTAEYFVNDEMVAELLQLIQQTFESCLPEKEDYEGISIWYEGRNAAIDEMKSNFKAILEGKE